MREGPLNGRVALVTGAGRRIGRRLALRLAAEGAQVAVHYHRSRAEAEAVAAEITAGGGEAFCVAADLTRPADIDTLFAAIENRCQAARHSGQQRCGVLPDAAG